MINIDFSRKMFSKTKSTNGMVWNGFYLEFEFRESSDVICVAEFINASCEIRFFFVHLHISFLKFAFVFFFFITLCDLSNWYWAIAHHSSFGFWSGESFLVILFFFILICLIGKYSCKLNDCYSESYSLHSRLILVTVRNQAMYLFFVKFCFCSNFSFT